MKCDPELENEGKGPQLEQEALVADEELVHPEESEVGATEPGELEPQSQHSESDWQDSQTKKR
eukprot:2967969-Amphidinium_carterae.1